MGRNRDVKNTRASRRSVKHTTVETVYDIVDNDYIHRPVVKVSPINPLNIPQRSYFNSIHNNLVTFCMGPSGTGKTFIAISIACELLEDKKIEKLIITRPAVTASERDLGALPGTLEEKFEPYMKPIIDILIERLGESNFKNKLKNGRIVFAPIDFIRGTTFKNCWVMMTEGQNSSVDQMKLFLTRFGDNCKMIVEGDIGQRDIRVFPGLSDGIAVCKQISSVGTIRFTSDDIVRHGFVKEVVKAYEAHELERYKEADLKLLNELDQQL
jgi:phosphate starvation-inducible PhoH-like protein